MAGPVGANLFISGILGMAAGVADLRRDDARDFGKGEFDTPEATRCEDGFLVPRRPQVRILSGVILHIIGRYRIRTCDLTGVIRAL